LFVALALCAVTILVIQRNSVLTPFERLQREAALADNGRAIEALAREVHHLNGLSHDWANWDELYQFAADGNSTFRAANLNPSSIAEILQADLLFICRPNGSVVFSSVNSVTLGGRITMREMPPDTLAGRPELLAGAPGGQPVHGSLMTEHGPILLSTQPIHNSMGGGASHGTLILGRFLDEELLRTLRGQTHVDFDVVRPDAPDLTPEEAALAKRPVGSPSTLLTVRGRSYVYGLVPGVRNQAALMVRSDVDTDLVVLGRSVGTQALLSSLILLVVLGAAALIFLRPNRRPGEWSFEQDIAGTKRASLLVAGLGATATVIGTYGILNEAARDARTDFQMAARQSAERVHVTLDEGISQAASLQRMVHSEQTLSDGVFSELAGHWRFDLPGAAAAWAPLVRGRERKAFITRYLADHAATPEVTVWHTIGGSAPVAPDAALYSPLAYVAPRSTSYLDLGSDLLTDPAIALVARTCIETGSVRAGPVMPVVRDGITEQIMPLLAPVYGPGPLPQTMTQRMEAARGCVVVFMPVTAICRRIAQDLEHPGLPMAVTDVTLAGTAAPIFSSLPTTSDLRLETEQYTSEVDIDLAGRSMRVVMKASPAYLAHRTGALPWVVLVAGLLLTGSVTAYIRVISVRGAAVEKLVELRTTQLAAANDDLARAVAETRAATEAKSTFLAHMSHEIRTPMNGVLGMVGLLVDTPLTPEQRQYADMIVSSGDSLLTIINDILDYSKVEAGRLELEVVDFDLRELVEETVEALAAGSTAAGIEVAARIEADVPVRLRGDSARMRQIITNLVGNALKFTEKGHVDLLVSAAEAPEDASEIRFEVHDVGIGVVKERRDRLFTPFAQAEAATYRQYGGTGLGLAICKRLVELMGGDIGYRPGEPAGSVFWFTARLARGGDACAPAPVPDALKQARLLVVDGNEVSRGAVSSMLGGWGVRHDVAADGETALRKISQAIADGDAYALALVAQRLSDLEASEFVRQAGGAGALRLVTMAALKNAPNPDEARAAGFLAVVTKPVRRSTLLERLMTALTGVDERAKPPQEQQPAAGADRGGEVRVLVAEDNAVNQRVALGILRKLGVTADIVANGRLAVEALEQTRYGLVLMDCQMPEMGGFEATAAIRAEGSAVLDRNVPIVAMTAHAMVGDRDRCLAAGMDDYLAKPVSAAKVQEILDRWLPQRPEHEVKPPA
jgi:signal transduction histidine kinase/DNA-binding response OmpR family regulator/sensor domain CHASE-containing protein